MVKIKKTDRQNASKDLEQLQLSYITGENAKNTTTLKTVASILLQDIYPRESKTYVYTKIGM